MTDTPTTHQERRETIIDGLLSKIEEDVDDALPPDISKEARHSILAQTLADSRLVLDSLSIDQLRNECALDRHIHNAIVSAKYSANRIAEQRSRS